MFKAGSSAEYFTRQRFGIESNRVVSEQKGTWAQVQTLTLDQRGRVVWLKNFGEVKVFRTLLKDQKRHYIVYLPTQENTDKGLEQLQQLGEEQFKQWHDTHWQIEHA